MYRMDEHQLLAQLQVIDDAEQFTHQVHAQYEHFALTFRLLALLADVDIMKFS